METELKKAFLEHLDSEIKHYRERNTKVALSYVALVFLSFVAYGKGEIPKDSISIYVICGFYMFMLVLIPVLIAKTAKKSRNLKNIRSNFIREHVSDSYVVEILTSKGAFREIFVGGVNSFLLLTCTGVTLFALAFFLFV